MCVGLGWVIWLLLVWLVRVIPRVVQQRQQQWGRLGLGPRVRVRP